MAAINDNALAKFSGILEVRPAWTTGAYSRLASVRWLIANLDTSKIVEVKADDTWTVFKATDQKTTIETEFLEVFDRDTLALLFNGTKTDIAWTLVSWATQVSLSNTVGYDEFIKIENQNWDGSAVSVSGVSGATDWTLTDWTDYKVVKDDEGNYGIILISWWNITTLAQDFTITYDYTPNAGEDFTTKNDTQEVKSFELKITTTSNGKLRTITTSSAWLSSVFGLAFEDVVEKGDIAGAKLTFTSDKGSETTYHNEII